MSLEGITFPTWQVTKLTVIITPVRSAVFYLLTAEKSRLKHPLGSENVIFKWYSNTASCHNAVGKCVSPLLCVVFWRWRLPDVQMSSATFYFSMFASNKWHMHLSTRGKKPQADLCFQISVRPEACRSVQSMKHLSFTHFPFLTSEEVWLHICSFSV